MEDKEVKSKQEEPINEGDHVYTRIRGGRHEGNVSSPTFLHFPTFPQLSSSSNRQFYVLPAERLPLTFRECYVSFVG